MLKYIIIIIMNNNHHPNNYNTVSVPHIWILNNTVYQNITLMNY